MVFCCMMVTFRRDVTLFGSETRLVNNEEGGSVRQYRRAAYWMIAPALLVVALVALYPVAYSIFLSLHDVTPSSTGEWVGLTNYAGMFGDAGSEKPSRSRYSSRRRARR